MLTPQWKVKVVSYSEKTEIDWDFILKYKKFLITLPTSTAL